MKRLNILLWIALSIFIFSCNNMAESPANEKEQMQKPSATTDMQEPEFYQTDSAGRPPQNTGPGQNAAPPKTVSQDWDRKIVKNAVISAEVKDYNAFYSSLRQKLDAIGGYIAGEEQSQTEYKIQNSITIKVPVEEFDDALVNLTQGALTITEKKVNSQDVTTEIVDTRSRIEAKKQMRERYMNLLMEAKNVNDILTMEREINGVQEQIETAGGRVNYLRHAAVFSTIHLTYYQILNAEPPKDTDEQPSFGMKLKDAFGFGWEWISSFVVGLISIWPLLLLGFLIYVLFKKKRVKPTGA